MGTRAAAGVGAVVGVLTAGVVDVLRRQAGRRCGPAGPGGPGRGPAGGPPGGPGGPPGGPGGGWRGRPPGPPGWRGPRSRVVAVGTGRVTAPPDVLTLDMGVQVTTDSARAALTGANTQAAALLAVLAEHGVTGRDVATHGLRVHPEFGPNGERPRAYTASNQVQARLRQLDRAGELVDAAVGQVGDHVLLHGLAFAIDDPTPLLVDARRQAVEAALAQARELAEAAGRTLGPILSITEGQPGPGGPPMPMMRRAPMAGMAMAAPVEAGEQRLEVSVTVEVALE